MRQLFTRQIAVLAASFTCAVFGAHTVAAQVKPASGFGVGYTDIGPALGLGGIGGASASFGGRFEHALKPRGVAVMIEAEHTCMTLRGVRAGGSSTVTSTLLGTLRTDARSRQEFFALTGVHR